MVPQTAEAVIGDSLDPVLQISTAICNGKWYFVIYFRLCEQALIAPLNNKTTFFQRWLCLLDQ